MITQSLPFSPHKKITFSRNSRFKNKTRSIFPNKDHISITDTLIIHRASNGTKRSCECFDLHKDQIPYLNSWQWQKSFIKKRYLKIDKNEDNSDAILILQHPSVYTLGTGSLKEYINFDINNSPYEIYHTERGGEVTYHGPGQIIMYPIMNLRYHKMDLHWYLRSLEEVIIRALYSAFSINASRIQGFTGVWVGNEKIAAIGIRVSKWVTYHGLAINITTDLSPFKNIVPCGIKEKGVTSLKKLLLGNNEINKINDEMLIDLAYESLIREFSEVFQVSMDIKPVSDLNVSDN